MATTLQQLRKEAGYRTAKDFAEAIEVPPTTYARYDQSPDKIPLKQAWMIADFLHCSIDAVVGREPIDVDSMRGDVQKFYDDLSDENQKLFDEFKEFVALKEEAIRKKKQDAEDKQYRQFAKYYERLFFQKAEKDASFGDMLIFKNPEKTRSDFESFLIERARNKREIEIQEYIEDLIVELQDPSPEPIYDEHDEFIGYEDPEFLTDEEMANTLDAARTSITQEYEERDKEVIAKIMKAYDKLHEESDSIYPLTEF